MPPIVQSSYPNFHDELVEGQIANTQTCDIASRTLAAGATAVGFGRAVRRGAQDGTIVGGVSRAQIATLNETGFDATETDLTYDAATRAIRVGEYIVLESEIMHVSAVTATTLTVARGVLGSAGAAHADDTPVLSLDEVLFAGITVQDERLPAADGVQFTAGQEVPVLIRGSVAVQVNAAVSQGDQVVVTLAAVTGDDPEAAGAFSSRAVDANHIAIPNAVFETSAADDGLAVVRVAGVAPTFA